MKIAFPTQDDEGINSMVFDHFGSAPYFIIVDAATGESHATPNQNLDHAHGMCQPLVALGNSKVNAIVVGGIGGGALQKLNQAGVIVYRAMEGTISENMDMIQKGMLPQFSSDHICSHHAHQGQCGHH